MCVRVSAWRRQKDACMYCTPEVTWPTFQTGWKAFPSFFFYFFILIREEANGSGRTKKRERERLTSRTKSIPPLYRVLFLFFFFFFLRCEIFKPGGWVRFYSPFYRFTKDRILIRVVWISSLHVDSWISVGFTNNMDVIIFNPPPHPPLSQSMMLISGFRNERDSLRLSFVVLFSHSFLSFFLFFFFFLHRMKRMRV